MVFVLDRHKHPLMPCSEKRARLLLSRRQAVIHRYEPFTIRLKQRSTTQASSNPSCSNWDPGSKTTGIALVREEVTEAGRIPSCAHWRTWRIWNIAASRSTSRCCNEKAIAAAAEPPISATAHLASSTVDEHPGGCHPRCRAAWTT